MDGTILEWADKLKALRDRKAELEAEENRLAGRMICSRHCGARAMAT